MPALWEFQAEDFRLATAQRVAEELAIPGWQLMWSDELLVAIQRNDPRIYQQLRGMHEAFRASRKCGAAVDAARQDGSLTPEQTDELVRLVKALDQARTALQQSLNL